MPVGRAFILAVSIVVALGLVQQVVPAVRIVEPRDGDYVSGEVVLTAVVEPATQPVTRVELFADGHPVCVVERLPFSCPWHAGRDVHEHLFRAVAHLADGRRLVHTVRTRRLEHVESVDVDVVQVTATVLDGSRFVRGLPREAFRVYEDDRLQPIAHFAAENIPLELVTAIDISESMTLAIGEVRASVKRFLAALRPADRVTLVAFNENVFVVGAPTLAWPARIEAVDQLMPWGATALHDVIVRSFELVGRQAGRRGLVVFTDGDDTASRTSREAVERRAESSDALLYLIGQGRAIESPALRGLCERLAVTSGGRAFFPRQAGEVGRAFEAILEELSNQYLLTYVPPFAARGDMWHQIRVEVPGTRDAVRARQGYRMVGTSRD